MDNVEIIQYCPATVAFPRMCAVCTQDLGLDPQVGPNDPQGDQ